MKTFLTIAVLCLSINISAQEKDFTEKQLLNNKRVLEFSESMNSKPKSVINFLKCIKEETGINRFKDLPFFTGKLNLIVNEKIAHHNDELWEAIHEDCKEKEIFNRK